MRRFPLFFVSFILLASGLLPVPVQSQVTLDSCRVWAQRNSPLIRQYELLQRSADYSVNNAARGWIPQIVLSAQGTWQSDVTDMADLWDELGLSMLPIPLPDIRLQEWQGKVQMELMQPLWDGGKSLADKREALAQLNEETAQTDVDLYQLDGRVMDIFFGILLLDGQRQQLLRTDSLLEKNLERVNTLYRNGVALQSDRDAVEVERLTLAQRRTQVEYSRLAYLQMLSLLTGKDLQNETLRMPDAEAGGPAATGKGRPELRLLDAKSDVIAARRKTLLSHTIPQVYAFAQGWYGYPGLNMFHDMLSADWTWNAVVGVKMQWNIGAFYTLDNRLRQLKLAEQRLDVQRDLFKFNRDMQTMGENAEIVRLERALEDDVRIVQLRQSIRAASEVKYENGTITTSELLQKITDENLAQSARLLRKVELVKAKYKLYYIQ